MNKLQYPKWRKTYRKVKVKRTLAQALRLYTGRTTRRGSRGIALYFHDHSTRRGWGVSVTPRPLFTPAKDPVPIVPEAGWAPRPVWTGAENLAPPPGIDPRTAQSVASRYTDYATRPTICRKLHINKSNYNTTWFDRIYRENKTDVIETKTVRRKIVINNKIMGTAVAQWLMCCAKSRKVAGSIPDGVIGILHWHNLSDRTMALGSTQPLTEMSTSNISWG